MERCVGQYSSHCCCMHRCSKSGADAVEIWFSRYISAIFNVFVFTCVQFCVFLTPGMCVV